MRYFFEIAYNGKRYNGWQSQKTGLGVQAVMEEALKTLLQEPVSVVGSSRTDTGVHCEQQYFHVDIEKKFEERSFRQRLNSFLPSDILVLSVSGVRPDASARFDAVERLYRYQITRQKNPFLDGLAWHYFKDVNISTMNKAAALLHGEQDFECFSKVKTDVRHFLCEIRSAEWRQEEQMLIFYISANRFLRGMVRAIVGTLLDVGTGKIGIEEFESIIKSRDRKKAGANVPPYGLYLTKVNYRQGVFLK